MGVSASVCGSILLVAGLVLDAVGIYQYVSTRQAKRPIGGSPLVALMLLIPGVFFLVIPYSTAVQQWSIVAVIAGDVALWGVVRRVWPTSRLCLSLQNADDHKDQDRSGGGADVVVTMN